MTDALDARWNAAKPDIADAAERAGVDAGLMAKIAGFESQYDSTNRPIAGHKKAHLNTVTQFDGVKAMSSAYGYGQFTNQTWAGMVREYGEKYGVKGASALTDAQANTAEYRTDSRLQAGMLAEFTRQNVEKGARLGGPDADANVYALHNLGGSAGPKFLNALKDDPDQRVSAVLSKDVIERNVGLYGDGTVSVKQAYEKMGELLGKYDSYAADISGKTQGVQQPAAQAAQAHNPVAAPHHHVETQHHHAEAPHVLKHGDRGDAVRDLQSGLHQLGYTGENGRKLHSDGDFGSSTKAAVEAFQHDQHLKVDGVVGSATMKSMKNAQQQVQDTPPQTTPSLLDDPAHAGHAMFQQARSGVHQLDAEQGRVPDKLSDNIAGALTAAAKAGGLKRIDAVALSEDGTRVWAAQHVIPGALNATASVAAAQAVNTPIEKSAAVFNQAAQAQAQVQQTQQVQQVQGQQGPGGPAILR
ncbi:peptidoglycan-binding domain-containing protein [Dyella silvatica]|uniref:peptidoglycan-binding domain-containing protein n=1 Tax=Dyella silvatica TaxID=2992128 RepID=UPI00224FBAF7|nr:peptidoglycan-binding domain-containing protein [Dyella silvatica]